MFGNNEESLLISNCKKSFHHLCHCKAWFSYAADAPATWQPILPGILFWHENRSGQQYWSNQSLPLACLQSWLKFNFAGIPLVELCGGSSCWRRRFSFVREVSQAVPVAMSQIHRRHTEYPPGGLNSTPLPQNITKSASLVVFFNLLQHGKWYCVGFYFSTLNNKFL